MRRIAPVLLFLLTTFPAAEAQPEPAALSSSRHIALDLFRARFGRHWIIRYSTDGTRVTSLTGVPDRPTDPISDEWRRYLAPLGDLKEGDLAKPVQRQLGKMRQFIYRQKGRDGFIEDAGIIVQVAEDGGPYDILVNLVTQPPPAPVRPHAWALTVVASRFARDLEDARTREERPSAAGGVQTRIDVPERTRTIAIAGRAYKVYVVEARQWVETENGRITITALRDYFVDAALPVDAPRDLAIVRIKERLLEFREHGGRVFDPNPNKALKRPLNPAQLSDDELPYVTTVLCDLDDVPSGNEAETLTGRYVAIVDIDGGKTPPLFQPDQLDVESLLKTPRATASFAAMNAYYHLDLLQRHVRWLGFDQLIGSEPIRADIHTLDKSAKLHASYTDEPPGFGFLSFARLNIPSVFAAEDGEVVAHEFAHAILALLARGRFQIDDPTTKRNEAIPMNEGFGDYWALSSFARQSLHHGASLDCFAQWGTGGARCKRDYTSNALYRNFKDDALPHINGQIWSGTLYDIFDELEHHRETVDTMILQGHLNSAFRDDRPTMLSVAHGILIADKGAHTQTLCRIFKKHDIPVDCSQSYIYSLDWRIGAIMPSATRNAPIAVAHAFPPKPWCAYVTPP